MPVGQNEYFATRPRCITCILARVKLLHYGLKANIAFRKAKSVTMVTLLDALSVFYPGLAGFMATFDSQNRDLDLLARCKPW